jgi:hypothetical protein
LTSARGGLWSDTTGSGNQNVNCQSNTFAAGINYFMNTISDHGWQMVLSGSGAPNVNSNDISNYGNWSFPPSTYHTDGIIISGNGNSIISPFIYNNYFHGSLNPTGGGNATGYVYCTEQLNVSGGSSCTIFNNVFDMPQVFNASPIVIDNEDIGPHKIYNNTFNGAGSIAGATVEVYNNSSQASGGAPTIDVRNNIGANGGNVWVIHEEAWQMYNISAFDHNNWNLSAYSSTPFDFQTSVGGMVLSLWQGMGFDTHSSFANPALASTNLAQNLTSSCTGQMTALCYDKPMKVGQSGALNGVLRASSGSWDAGAYQFGTTNVPAPPDNLAASVQ